MHQQAYKQDDCFFTMLKELKEYKFPYLKRRKLINLLTESGFVLRRNTFGNHIYVAHPKKDDAKIENHYLPIALITFSSYTPLNLDEPSFKTYHEEIQKIYHKLVG